MTTKIKAIAVNIDNQTSLVFPYNIVNTNYYSYCDSWDDIGGHSACHISYTETKYRETCNEKISNLVDYYESNYYCKIQLIKRVNQHKTWQSRKNQYFDGMIQAYS